MNTITKSILSVSLLSATLMGCMAATTVATAEQGMAQPRAMTTSMTKDPQTLNDLEIAHFAYTAGNIDIRYAHLALALSDDPEVRQFAELMVRDHTAINNKALALVNKLHITPQDNPISQKLSQQALSIRNELAALRADALAKRYAANELGYHRFVNKAVEHTLIPNAQNPELKALLIAALQTFKVHEAHAEAMNQKVM